MEKREKSGSYLQKTARNETLKMAWITVTYELQQYNVMCTPCCPPLPKPCHLMEQDGTHLPFSSYCNHLYLLPSCPPPPSATDQQVWPQSLQLFSQTHLGLTPWPQPIAFRTISFLTPARADRLSQKILTLLLVLSWLYCLNVSTEKSVCVCVCVSNFSAKPKKKGKIETYCISHK